MAQQPLISKIDALISSIDQCLGSNYISNSYSSTAGKVIKCKAAIAWKIWDEKEKEPLTIEEVEVAVPKDNEVRIKILFTGVCHSDWHCLAGRNPAPFPMILGHEGVGVVESIGNKVTTVKPGDAVIPLWLGQCNKCKMCLSGKSNLCDNGMLWFGTLADKTVRFKSKSQNKDIYHFLGTSTFSQYTVCEEYCVAKIDNKVLLNENILREVCLVGCCVTTGIGSVRNTMKVEKGSTAVVFGLGGVGLSAVQGCRLNQCSRIIGIDINPKKFDIAKKMGCTECINPLDYPNDSMQDIIVQKTDGGVDYSFECIGLPSTMRSALECCHKGWGESCIIGVAEETAEIKTRPFQLVTGRVWRGSLFGGTKGRNGIPQIVNEYLDGKIDINTIITDVLPFSQINKGFWLMKQKEKVSIRTVVDLWN